MDQGIIRLTMFLKDAGGISNHQPSDMFVDISFIFLAPKDKKFIVKCKLQPVQKRLSSTANTTLTVCKGNKITQSWWTENDNKADCVPMPAEQTKPDL